MSYKTAGQARRGTADMAKYKLDFDAFSSVLNLYPDGDPYEEADQLAKKVSEGSPLTQDTRTVSALKSIVDIDRYSSARSLGSDIKRLTDDYQAASKQFFATVRNARRTQA
ncbi:MULTISPECIES: hypothetical protein [unclassified Pseudomonas]|uniref:hypothetical protein n=1 Tax=unclassified Pseudomonas TaxID=196821 RepID=UPI00128B2D2F|nr:MULTISPECIES: hypothetical protein [unclassified Pseudomonas]MPQ70733.1 hypothetical protein [Pseudomonas sp. MWU12-2323]